MARPTKLTASVIKKIVEAIKAGATHEHAAQYAGIHVATFYDWKAKADAGEEAFAEFAEALKTAEGKGAVELLKKIQSAAEDPKYWAAAAWILERRHPDTYGRQRIEHTGKDGGPIYVKTYKGLSPDDWDESTGD
jgi:transposase